MTGATGLIGREVVARLVARGTPVTALVRDPGRARALLGPGVSLRVGDVTTAESWREEEASGVIHCAASIVARAPWSEFERANVEATRLAAGYARARGIPLVHVSSVAVYGGASRAPVGTVAEDHPFAPIPARDYYARSKRLAEAAVWEAAAHGLRAVALRPCVVYGTGDRLFVPRLVAAARRGWMPVIGGAPRPVTLVHARSVAAGIVSALDRPASWGRAYNLTFDGAITAREIAAALGRGVGRRVRTPVIPAAVARALGAALDATAGLFVPAGAAPGSARTAIAYWRGGNPYRCEAAAAALGWNPRVDHAAELEALARQG